MESNNLTNLKLFYTHISSIINLKLSSAKAHKDQKLEKEIILIKAIITKSQHFADLLPQFWGQKVKRLISATYKKIWCLAFQSLIVIYKFNRYNNAQAIN